MQPIFIDFEASSLSAKSWPIEVGIARLDADDVVVKSKLICPHDSWSMTEWHPESEAVHGIPRGDLNAAGSAEDVAKWLQQECAGRVLVSDAPEFDQRWLDTLMQTAGETAGMQIDDFDRVAWFAFSDEDGRVAPGQLNRVYAALTERKTLHRAGDDAANLAYAWREGCRRE